MSDAHAQTAPGGPEGAHHGDHGHGDIDSHVRKAFVVFGALLVLTGLTVGVSYLHLPVGQAIALALLIATVKGALVTLWFMHLISERKLVFAVLALTVSFFFTLLFLPYWTTEDIPAVKSPTPVSGASKSAFTNDKATPVAGTGGHGAATPEGGHGAPAAVEPGQAQEATPPPDPAVPATAPPEAEPSPAP